VWGDTVNIASRMESVGVAGRVNLSAYSYDLVREAFDCEYRGKVDAKGKGQIDMYLVIGVR
jgi:class 3 adenylate cyclase